MASKRRSRSTAPGAVKDSSSKERKLFRLIDGAVFSVLLIDIYALASIFTSWTGAWGRHVSNWLLSELGGASLLLLLYVAYLSSAYLLDKRVRNLRRQTLGTLVFYLTTSLMLGMLEANFFDVSRLLSPGKIGLSLVSFLYRNIGPLGLTLTGLCGATFALVSYGRASIRSYLERAVDAARNLMPKRTKEEKKEGPTIEKGEMEVSLAEVPQLSRVSSGESEVTSSYVAAMVEEEAFEEEDGFVLPPEVEPGRFPPPVDILGVAPEYDSSGDEEIVAKQGERIVETLKEFDIDAELAETVFGPTVVQFRLQLAPGIKVSRVAALSNDLAVALAVPSLRVEAPIPGKPYIGVEVPNPHRRYVHLSQVIGSEFFQGTSVELPLPMGVSVEGVPLVTGLEGLPHLLVAGTTGSGKSVFISSCIIGLCFKCRPDELKLLLVDPKRVEMTLYEHLPHTLTPPICDVKTAVHALAWAIREMERRYELFARARVRNVMGYNEHVLPKDRLPYIVIIIDELADLMMTSPKEVEDYICRLAQMARATGIHLILATQRPSVNVITGLIKANIPARAAFTLPSQVDSRTIIDVAGAEKLLGKGDMLFVTTRFPKPVRVQAPWIDEDAIGRFIQYMVSIFGEPEHIDLEEQGGSREIRSSCLDDPLLEKAVRITLETGIASASRLQRQLRVGFTRAARLVDAMEELGIVGAQDGSKPREILVDEEKAAVILEEALRGDKSEEAFYSRD
ncbi:MAG: segregation ATPase FtsK/SpoIIIE, family [Synergistaceae bacterium]|nr:segregation ATPase FtsK/SpoIIIE, family [Synergistaceae bacterium]